MSKITLPLCFLWIIKNKIEIKKAEMYEIVFQPAHFSFSNTGEWAVQQILLPLCSVSTWSAGSNHEAGSPPRRRLCPPAWSQRGHREATAAPLTGPGRRRCTAEAGGPHGRLAASEWGWAGRGATPKVHLEQEKSIKKTGRSSCKGNSFIPSVPRWMQNYMH